MVNSQLQNILYRYANTKGVGLPLTAEEMLNAISSWLVDTLPDCIDVDIEMLPVGSKPTVKLTGQGTPDNHYKFSFGIPESVQVTDVTIEENGDLVFTYNNGEQDNAGAIVANIEIGQVDTLPAGSQATASFSGTTKNKVLDLGIPQGIQGETGALVYKAIGQTSRVPTVGSSSLNVSGFNRTPIAGETFVRYVQGIRDIAGRMWFEFCTALGTFTAGTLADVTVDNVIEITGEQGATGENGFGFSDTTVQTFTPSTVSYADGVATIHGSMSTQDGSDSVTSELTFNLPIEVGDGVTIGANEAGDGIVVSLGSDSGVKLYKHVINDGHSNIVGLITTSPNSITNFADIFNQMPILGVYDAFFKRQGVYMLGTGKIAFYIFNSYNDTNDSCNYLVHPITSSMTLSDEVTQL